MDASAYQSFARNEHDHFWWVGRRAIYFDVLRRYVTEPNKSSVVFDLGCGVGGMLEPLRDYGHTVGMDVDRGALAYCRSRNFQGVFEGRGHALPLRTESIDLIAAFDVLEHIPEERETIAECYRVLRPGGWLFLSGPSYQFLYTHQDKMVDHQRRYTVRELHEKFSDAGFEIVRQSYVNFFLFPVILLIILFKKVREGLSPPPPGDARLNSEIRLPSVLNSICAWIFSAERFLMRYVSLPFGHSLMLLVRKPNPLHAT